MLKGTREKEITTCQEMRADLDDSGLKKCSKGESCKEKEIHNEDDNNRKKLEKHCHEARVSNMRGKRRFRRVGRCKKIRAKRSM